MTHADIPPAPTDTGDRSGGWLVITRHGKAERDSDTGLDRDRVLRRRGHRQAAWLGEQLHEMGFGEAAIVSSQAARASQTAEGIATALGLSIEFDPRLLVDEPASAALELIAERLKSNPRVVLVGHNPQVSRLVSIVTGGVTASTAGLRTGEAAVVRFAVTGTIGAGEVSRVLRLRDSDEDE